MDELIEHALDAADDSLARAFLDTRQVFWVDENDDPATIVRACAAAAGLEVAAGPDGDRPSALVGGRRVDLGTRDASIHRTLMALDRELRQTHRLRLALVSVGDDALAFVVLPSDQWRQLDDDIGDALAQVVWQLDDDLDPFVDLDEGEVLSAYTDLLADEPGRFGDCLARALANPGAVAANRDEGADDLLRW